MWWINKIKENSYTVSTCESDKPWNLQMTLETKSSTMQITQNETQTTINYSQKNLSLYLIDQYNPLDL